MIEKKKKNVENHSKLNIMYIAHERKMGGASLCLLTLAKEMKEKGHHVCVVVPFMRSPIAKKLREAGIKTIGIVVYDGRNCGMENKSLHQKGKN